MNAAELRRYNRNLLRSQFLTRRAKGKDSLTEISRACCGINSQNMRDSFLSFWARSASFSENALVRQMKPSGSLLRTWTVRSTVHTFPAEDYYMNVFGSPVDRILSSHDRYARQLGLPSREDRMKKLYEPLIDHIGSDTATTGNINEFVSRRLMELGLKGYRKLDRGWTRVEQYGPAWEGITEMSYLGILASAGRKGAENLWMSAARRLSVKLKDPDLEECTTALVRSYIGRYGPVSQKDIAYWSGHRIRDVEAALERLKGDLYTTAGKTGNVAYYSLEDEIRNGGRVPGVILLPRFDSLIMGYQDKSRVLEQSRLGHISSGSGIIEPTLLIDGFVAGTWKKSARGKNTKVVVRTFHDLDGSNREAVRERFSHMGEYMGTDMHVEFRALK